MKAKAGKGLLIVCAIMLVVVGIVYLVHPTDETQAKIPDVGSGYVSDMVTDEDIEEHKKSNDIDTNGDGKLSSDEFVTSLVVEGETAKKLKSYPTLHDAEEEMGYYLGFHNEIAAYDGYELTRIYRIGDNEWYQAIFEDSTGNEPILTVKTSKTNSIDYLIEAYSKKFDLEEIGDVKGIKVYFKGSSQDKYDLAYFETPNNKKYSIYLAGGVPKEFMLDIVVELVDNLKSMTDWVN